MNKDIQSKVVGIFPTPIYSNILENNFSKKEKNFLEKQIKIVKESTLSLKKAKLGIPKNVYILNSKELKNLKNNLLLEIKNYFKEIIDTSNQVEPYINQSWLNFTVKGAKHYSHYHENSYLSGVLYLEIDKTDKIIFAKSNYLQIDIEPKNYNPFNSQNWHLPITKNQVLLFPSRLFHSVETKVGDKDRISLAFNVFLKGKIGEERLLRGLNL
jgi:uncharacterized protein (TIGR02466 family)|tara:strand:+ start:1657 stop:2295 length:639 start_codon:yes stop_codon:yes gene_type:complete